MNTNTQQPWLLAIVTFAIGLIVGWMVLGWNIAPVQWTDAAPVDLAPDDKNLFILTTSELYAFDQDMVKVEQRMLRFWPVEQAVEDVCSYGSTLTDPALRSQVEALAEIAVRNIPTLAGTACLSWSDGSLSQKLSDAGQETGAGDTGSNSLIPVLLLLLLLGALLGAIYFVIQRRNALMSEVETHTIGGAMPEAPPTTVQGSEDSSAIPLARFQSAYAMGRDNYDDSFSIENTSGDFLGECGVGISESIGTDVPKNVTAFEVWLFDKNDIRTVTKVIMSDHAFFDEALKAKLAPKGEPVLARENEIVVLETASLIVNAEIKSMNYGSGTLPPQSFFDNFTVELSAWAKEGDAPAADVEGRVDELLDF
ncbi:MAG: hypothetical protein AAF490_02700 [Chloroflexota bacterium]